MQGVMNLLWEKLLPAFGPKRLKADAANQGALQQKLASLSVRVAQGARSAPMASRIFARKFVFPANEQKLESFAMVPTPDEKGIMFALQVNGAESRFTAGVGEWIKGRGAFGTYSNTAVAGSAAWPANDTCVVNLCLTETPFYTTFKLRFDGDNLYYDSETNVGFRATRQPQLVGRAQ